jgi:DNA/RNA-binding domain of Phe-tRNA-synthetase-like protein
MLKGRMQLFQEHLFFDLEEKELSSVEGVNEWRALWKKFGSDPGRYRPSIEALLRRIRKQNYLSPVNSVIDLNTFFSLQYEIPVGIYDASSLKGDMQLLLGNSETSYTALNGRENRFDGILVLVDDNGPFGSPYVDSQRTAVTEHTTEAYQVFFLRPSIEMAEAEEMLAAAGKMFTQVNGGEFNSILLNKDHSQN